VKTITAKGGDRYLPIMGQARKHKMNQVVGVSEAKPKEGLSKRPGMRRTVGLERKTTHLHPNLNQKRNRGKVSVQKKLETERGPGRQKRLRRVERFGLKSAEGGIQKCVIGYDDEKNSDGGAWELDTKRRAQGRREEGINKSRKGGGGYQGGGKKSDKTGRRIVLGIQHGYLEKGLERAEKELA